MIESGLPLLQLSEITGIHHRAYRSLASPLILRPESVIQLRSASFEGAFLCYDHLCFNLDQETEIEVFQSQKQVQLPGTGIWPICSGCGFYFSREPVEQIHGWESRERIGTEGK